MLSGKARQRPRIIDYVPTKYRKEYLQLTKAEADVFSLILSYMKWKLAKTGNLDRARCFTYDGVFRHADINNVNLRRLTIDRNIRKLREKNLLYSFKTRRTVVYCLPEDLASGIAAYFRDLDEWRMASNI